MEDRRFIEDVEDIIVLVNEDPAHCSSVNQILLAVVEGVCDPNSVLSRLNGSLHILQRIWEILKTYWHNCISYGSKEGEYNGTTTISATLYFDRLFGGWSFPKNQLNYEEDLYNWHVNITMMPFIITRSFESSRLPIYLRPYWKNFIGRCYCYFPHVACVRHLTREDDLGKVGFLTIREGFVEPGEFLFGCGGGVKTQCCSRLKLKHDPADGKFICVSDDEEAEVEEITSVGGGGTSTVFYPPYSEDGRLYAEYLGGMYMTVNLPDTCRIWNCQITAIDDDVKDWTRPVEQFREFLPRSGDELRNGVMMEANTLYWLTDRTPYEWLPSTSRTYQQVFQFVLPDVSVWFEEFSTPNPLGIIPDPTVTKIVKSSKKLNLDDSYTERGPNLNTHV